MSREDVRYMVRHCPFAGLRNFIRPERWEEFRTRYGSRDPLARLGTVVLRDEEFAEIPDEWLDCDGEIVLDNMGDRAPGVIQRDLGIPVPLVPSKPEYEEAKTRGGTAMIRLPRAEEEPVPERTEWMAPEDLRTRLDAVPDSLREPDSETGRLYATLRAVAERGFECAIIW